MDTVGLRQRKKQRTREALIEAAVALFCANGYDATTVDQIAEAVEVSPRTFFRYFNSKQDIALSLADAQITAMLTAFEAQPAGVPVLTAMRQAVVEVVRAAAASAPHDRMRDLISGNPALTAARFERGSARLDEVARLVGARMGVEPVTDPRPRLMAAVTLCAVPTAVDAWRSAGRDEPDADLIEQAFDLLAAGLDYPAAEVSERR